MSWDAAMKPLRVSLRGDIIVLEESGCTDRLSQVEMSWLGSWTVDVQVVNYRVRCDF